MPVRLGVLELLIILSCLIALIALGAIVAVLLLRSRPAAGDAEARRDQAAPEVMTPEEVAGLLRVDVETVEALIRDGKLPAVRVGDDWRISRAAVTAFINTGGVSEDE
jgi:excisionase family DNA binding protein